MRYEMTWLKACLLYMPGKLIFIMYPIKEGEKPISRFDCGPALVLSNTALAASKHHMDTSNK